jgi:hypothetical protein
VIEISQINQNLSQNAVIVVFVNVLLQQIGLPLPAVPTLMLAGSLAATPGSLGLVLAAAIVASVIADWVWYAAGKAFGYRVLAGCASCRSIRLHASVRPRRASCAGVFRRWSSPNSSRVSPRWHRRLPVPCACDCPGFCSLRRRVRACGQDWRSPPAG